MKFQEIDKDQPQPVCDEVLKSLTINVEKVLGRGHQQLSGRILLALVLLMILPTI